LFCHRGPGSIITIYGHITLDSTRCSAIEVLEQDQLAVQSMMTSRYVERFVNKVAGWQRGLATLDAALSVLTELQGIWAYLRELYLRSEKVRRELPESTAAFAEADKRVRACIVRCRAGGTVLGTCTQQGFLEEVEGILHKLQQCEKALLAYVESTQRAFPRFYFVSIKDLLEILANATSPEKIQPHIPTIFQAVNVLDLRESRSASGKDVHTAAGLFSANDEFLPFGKPCHLEGEVEIWLGRTIAAMRAGVSKLIQSAIPVYADCISPGMEKHGISREEFCQEWQASS
jgi:dynein heavy chain, axonemal